MSVIEAAAAFLNDAISLQIPRGTRAIDAIKYCPSRGSEAGTIGKRTHC